MEFYSLQIAKDIVLIITAIITGTIAIIGIYKWKNEFKGKVFFELSYKLLKSIYRLRDSFYSLRANYISIEEMLPRDYNVNNYEYENTYFVINNRLKPFNEAVNEFKSILPEVEALFGKKLKVKCADINQMLFLYQNKLNTYFQLYGKTNNTELFEEVAKCVFMQSKDDKFKAELDKIISSIENEISKHIKLK